jgi:LAO/AO transport system kinase
VSAVSDLARALSLGDRRALAKAITLVESSRHEDEEAALALLSVLGPTGGATFRVGVTGVPGAGKSTLIDALGLTAIEHGKRVAVLAVDPSSRASGGSVLGDKTRMTRLSAQTSAFIRPSPTRGVLGGTAGRTRELILLCEAAGYDLIFVETVGVGQAEERVASMVDCVVLVLLAGAGDELSNMKKGVLEVADVIAFNKADAGRTRTAETDASAFRRALSISRNSDGPDVVVTSALEGSGVVELWALLNTRFQNATSGSLIDRRIAQRTAAFDDALDQALRGVFLRDAELTRHLRDFERAVQSGAISPFAAAQQLVARLVSRHSAADAAPPT